MKKRFKKYHRYKISHLISLIIVLIFIYVLIYIISNIKLLSNDFFINTILKDTNSYIEYKADKSTILDAIFYLEAPFNYNSTSAISIKYYKSDEPVIYIYNTHDEEGYLSDYKEGYNLEPTIIDATKLLQNELNNRGIVTIVEDRKVSIDRTKRGLTFVPVISKDIEIQEEDEDENEEDEEDGNKKKRKK